MVQQITVTTDATVDVRPLVESAIRRQLALLAVGVARTHQRIAEIEARVGMSGDEYERLRSTGELGESLELLELEGEIRTLSLLEAQEVALRDARIS
jgi:hypothetical protein